MSKDPEYITKFKEYTRGPMSLADLPKLEREIYKAGDRATAVLMGSILENSLETFLRWKTRPSLNHDDRRALFDYGGPLGDFASKTIVGYAFNWYGPETKHDLNLIRLIRNEFAHSRRSFGFSTPQTAAVCAQLKIPDWEDSFIPYGVLEPAPEDFRAAVWDKKDSKMRYLAACHTISHALLMNSGGVDANLRIPDLR